MEQAPENKPVSVKRRSGVVVPHRPKWHGKIAAALLWLLGSCLFRTWRVHTRDESGFLNPHAAGPAIFAIWHNRLATAMSAWDWVQKQGTDRDLTALISASRDGGLLSRTFEHFGVKPVRGSSSRRGPQALLELVTAIEQGSHVAITPDGPRGPKYVVNEGIILLAQKTGAPIVPFGATIARKVRLRSWDAFQVPLPFSKCELVFGTAIHVPSELSVEERQNFQRLLERVLKELNPE